MRPSLLFSLTVILMIFAAVGMAASEPADSVLTKREAAMQVEINRFETQLKNVRQTISELETELESARNEHAVMQQAAAVDAGASASTTGAAHSGDVFAAAGQARPGLPASITRLGAEELALGGVEDLSRLEYLAPGLRYGQTGHDVRLSMRGARTNSVGPEAASVVGVFEDGVYIPTSTARLESLLDVARIDVLRGPQITNFGQHAYAGAINIVTNKPTFDGFHGYAEAENGLPDKTRWRLVLNIPVSDTLVFRMAGLSESRSGWISNFVIEPDSDDLNDRKEQTLRTSLLWQPSDNFNILLRRKYQDENGTGSAPWGYQQIGAYVDGELKPGHQFAPVGFVPDSGPWAVYRNFISAAQYEHEVNTIDLNWDMGFARAQWLSSYTKYEGTQTYDNDYSSEGEFTSSAFAGWGTSESGWSSELRLSSNGNGALNWLLGLYWSDQEANWGWLEAKNGVISQPDWDVNGDYLTDTQAVFGQVSYQFADRLTISGGLRWNEDNKTLKTGEKGSWDDILWKGALEYDINDHTMGYISASSGYLAGGINSAPGVKATWQPEKLTAYEFGLKSVLADGDVLLNLAAWYNDFKDVQSQSFLVLPFPGSPEATEYTGNGGAMDARGIEAEIQWSPTPRWNLATNIAYTDATFGDYVAANLNGLGDIPGHTDGDLLSFDGWSPALSPEWVIGLRASYSFEFENWGTLTPYLQSTYASDYYVSDINLPGVRQDSHTRTDFRLIWQATDSFQIQIYYLNLEDTATLNWARVYNPAARPDITTLQANWNNPATNGIIFNYRF
ncbi:MAG: TonB-dependent receptor [Proteobacteria bacterium]|nr:TonB-dependent receptor [Pseudomonadota bacterium]